jgi:diphthine-ammonia ligase
MKGKDLLHQFIEAGFEAVVIAVKPDLLDAFWLGRIVEEEFINEVEKQGADICGEKGEYHTLVIDGPIFRKRIAIKNTNVIRRHEVSFVELLNSDVEEKGDKINYP